MWPAIVGDRNDSRWSGAITPVSRVSSTVLVLCHRLYKRGFFCFVCGHDWSTMRLQPRLTIEEERLEALVVAIREEVLELCELV